MYSFFVDDECDDITELSCCIERDANWNFWLKDGLDYSSVFPSGDSVFEFLKSYVDESLCDYSEVNCDNSSLKVITGKVMLEGKGRRKVRYISDSEKIFNIGNSEDRVISA